MPAPPKAPPTAPQVSPQASPPKVPPTANPNPKTSPKALPTAPSPLQQLPVRTGIVTSNSSSKTRGAAAPRTRITCAYFLGSEEPSLKLSRLAKLQRTNSSPNSNCRRSKSAIFISRNINSNINSLLRLHVGTHIIYIYIYISIGRALHTGSRNENNVGAACGSP